jgi:hypothetical protein
MGRNTDEIKRLYKRLYELDKQSEKNKGKRFIASMLILIAMRFMLLCAIDKPHDVTDFLGTLLVAAVWGFFSYWIYCGIFLYLFQKSEAENSYIKYIKSEISRLEETQDDDEQ